ncbi:hypothetical protein MKZ38_004595 [Zalerion maritima]|uniref:Uncharacterized protein n=1 Tax=Zalerion maritima TaxID=339359 RepID=A0AAD5WV06_9PEZI|nr:hypothetical protein MKZ38_004595 [Zalerion maritima]
MGSGSSPTHAMSLINVLDNKLRDSNFGVSESSLVPREAGPGGYGAELKFLMMELRHRKTSDDSQLRRAGGPGQNDANDTKLHPPPDAAQAEIDDFDAAFDDTDSSEAQAQKRDAESMPLLPVHFSGGEEVSKPYKCDRIFPFKSALRNKAERGGFGKVYKAEIYRNHLQLKRGTLPSGSREVLAVATKEVDIAGLCGGLPRSNNVIWSEPAIYVSSEVETVDEEETVDSDLNSNDIHLVNPHKWLQCLEELESDRKALMLDMVVQFGPAGDAPVEADSDDEWV